MKNLSLFSEGASEITKFFFSVLVKESFCIIVWWTGWLETLEWELKWNFPAIVVDALFHSGRRRKKVHPTVFWEQVRLSYLGGRCCLKSETSLYLCYQMWATVRPSRCWYIWQPLWGQKPLFSWCLHEAWRGAGRCCHQHNHHCCGTRKFPFCDGHIQVMKI